MEKVKIYLNEARNGFVICHKCGKSKQLDFSNRKIPRSALVKCSCGNTFAVFFEKRKYYRKQLGVNGTCFVAGDSTGGSPVKIIDISRGGIHFLKKAGRSPQPNEKIRVVFPLGDEIINCIVAVCDVQSERVGATFINIDLHHKKLLGFFLLP